MGITVTRNDIEKNLDHFLSAVQQAQIRRLQKLGEMCVIEARTNKGYQMQTGALTSSTGYEIFVNGVAIHSNFEVAVSAESGAANTGIQAGKEIAQKVGQETSGVALVVVAGMNYASYVEAKGKIVLSGAERLASKELPNVLAHLIDNINKSF